LAQSSKKIAVLAIIVPAVVALVVGFFQYVLPLITRSKAPESHEFVGVVRDAAGRGIRGAKVSLEAKDVPPVQYTDSEGVFSFRVTPDVHKIKIRVDAEGYLPEDRTVTVDPKMNPEDIRLTALNRPTPSPTVAPPDRRDHDTPEGLSTKPPQPNPNPTVSLAERRRRAREILNSGSPTPP
jgi:hypothetical protein